ncbi:MAG: hypothetical protein AAGB19_00700 [Cyanobacteria bacterium P01_F01_bin.3]
MAAKSTAKSKEALLSEDGAVATSKEALTTTDKAAIQKMVQQSSAKNAAKESSARKSASKKTTKSTTARKTATKKATTKKTTAKEPTAKKASSRTAGSSKTQPIAEEQANETIDLFDTVQAEQLDQSESSEFGSTELNQPELARAKVNPPLEDSQLDASQLDKERDKQLANFLAADCVSDSIWSPDVAVPTLDEATYKAQKAQAEAQRRAIEVASLNLQNIKDLHQLERQSIDVEISMKENEARSAQLVGVDIERQIQLEVNDEKSQHLRQAAARKDAATRESDYADQLIALKDQNFELDIQQAQNVFAEKAARYRAQLTGQ